VSHPTAGWGKRRGGDQGTLARRLAGAVDIEDEQAVVGMVKEATEEVS
jgi:hypothetical protein